MKTELVYGLLCLWCHMFIMTECGGLKENGPIGSYLNTLSPLGRTVWEGLGMCGFIGGGVTLGMDSEISKDYKISTILFFSLILGCGIRCSSHHVFAWSLGTLIHYSHLNDNRPQELKYVNTWSSVDGTVWGGLRLKRCVISPVSFLSASYLLIKM